jgi:hypothetical protein
MPRIVPLGVFSHGFDLVSDSAQPTAAFRGSVWREAGVVLAAGQEFEFRREGRRRFVLDGRHGLVASASRRGIFSSAWDVFVGERQFELARGGFMTRSYVLRTGGAEIGRVAKLGALKRGANADLPADFPLAAQVFISAIVLTQWRRDDAAAAGGAAAATGASG